eukprot:3635451-Rhodomonas_salina.5
MRYGPTPACAMFGTGIVYGSHRPTPAYAMPGTGIAHNGHGPVPAIAYDGYVPTPAYVMA